MQNDEKNGWHEWSKHVLLELERLGDGIEALGKVVAEIQNENVRHWEWIKSHEKKEEQDNIVMRIEIIEKWQYKMMGAYAVFIVVASAIFSLILHFIDK